MRYHNITKDDMLNGETALFLMIFPMILQVIFAVKLAVVYVHFIS